MWLYPVLAAIVVGAHAAYFLSGIYWPPPTVVPIESISAELLPEGDSLEAGERAPEGDSLDVAKVSAAEAENEPEPPPVEDKDAVQKAPPPKKKTKAAEKPKPAEKKPEKKKLDAARGAGADSKDSRTAKDSRPGQRYGVPGGTGSGAGTARVAGRFGVPGGRGQGSAAAQASCLAAVAGSIRRHTPGYTSLGPSTVYVTFYVNTGGGISGVSASGGSAAHAALARRIVASSRGPGSCAAAFASQSITFQ